MTINEPTNMAHIKSWILEGSNTGYDNDTKQWVVLHSQSDNNDLNGPLKSMLYYCNKSGTFKYFRIRMTDVCHQNILCLAIGQIDFFGSQPIHDKFCVSTKVISSSQLLIFFLSQK